MRKQRPSRPIQQTITMDQNTFMQVLGSLAVQPEQVEPPVRAPQKKQRPKLRVLPRRKKNIIARPQLTAMERFAAVTAVVAIFAAAILLVGKFAAISANNSRIEEKEAQLADLQRRGQQLEVQLEMSTDLNHVFNVASEELGMSAPCDSMRREIVLNDTANTNGVVAEEEEPQERGFMAMLNRITELLH